jgi:hypothetical protein
LAGTKPSWSDPSAQVRQAATFADLSINARFFEFRPDLKRLFAPRRRPLAFATTWELLRRKKPRIVALMVNRQAHDQRHLLRS